MDTLLTIILGVLGIIVTIVVTWYFTKKQTKNKEVSHLSISTYDIGEGLSDVFPEFQLQYNGNKLVGNVKVLKGAFFNTGSKDIGELDEKPIRLILPEGCKVKACSITFTSPSVNVAPDIKDDSGLSGINFKISDGLLKPQDCFEYTAIIETPKQIKSLQNELKIGPRKKDLDYRYLFKDSEEMPIHKEPVFWVFIATMMVLLGIYFVCLSFLPFDISNKIIDKKTNKEVSIYTNNKSDIFLVEENEQLSLFSNKTITKDQLYSNYVLLPNIDHSFKVPSLHLWFMGVFCATIILTGLLFIGYIAFMRKEKRLMRLLEKNKDTTSNERYVEGV